MEYKWQKKWGLISKWPACTNKLCCRSDVIYRCTQFRTVKFAVSGGLCGAWQAILPQPSAKPLPYVHFHRAWHMCKVWWVVKGWKSEEESGRTKLTEYKQKKYTYLGQRELLNRLVCSAGNLYMVICPSIISFMSLMTYIEDLTHTCVCTTAVVYFSLFPPSFCPPNYQQREM